MRVNIFRLSFPCISFLWCLLSCEKCIWLSGNVYNFDKSKAVSQVTWPFTLLWCHCQHCPICFYWTWRRNLWKNKAWFIKQNILNTINNRVLRAQFQLCKYQNNLSNLFVVNNKDFKWTGKRYQTFSKLSEILFFWKFNKTTLP